MEATASLCEYVAATRAIAPAADDDDDDDDVEGEEEEEKEEEEEEDLSVWSSLIAIFFSALASFLSTVSRMMVWIDEMIDVATGAEWATNRPGCDWLADDDAADDADDDEDDDDDDDDDRLPSIM